MADNSNIGRFELLETVLDVMQGKRGQNLNELVSLLALSNLLGIISFLNAQDMQDIKSNYRSGTSELKDMASSLLASMGGASDKKLNPAMLLNLLKNLSASDSSGSDTKSPDKTAEKARD